MPWLELQLTLDAALQPRAEAALETAGALSITLLDADADTPDEAAIFEPGVGATPLWKTLALAALFEAGVDRRALAQQVQAALPELPADRITFREIADRDWERAWMDRYHPMRFGRRLWIYPWNVEPPGKDGPHPLPSSASGERGPSAALRATSPGANAACTSTSTASGEAGSNAAPRTSAALNDDEAVIVRLDPGLAFGTGTHPTTALCLEWLDALDLSGKTVVDYGCGSGVLAIAALKLGAVRAIGIDNDPQALTASRDNAARNGVAERLALYAPDRLPGDLHAGVFVANILAGPLAELAPRFAMLCRPGAPFALSGILADQVPELLDRYRACGFTDLRTTRREDWVRIDGRRG